ncbi:preprotein translocase subunit Sec61beta [Mesobacillus subterraneus]|nr:preprotein translocase subunit Sec61beta [Mesobacillus subterraneus]
MNKEKLEYIKVGSLVVIAISLAIIAYVIWQVM